MDGRTKRSLEIMKRIRETALELFASRGVDGVSMDEIAARAGVSKVTVYKHFHSKQALQRQALTLWSEQVLAAVEQILDGDLDFPEKLRLILTFQVDRPPVAADEALFDLLDRDAQSGGELEARLKGILYRLVEEGKAGGYIDEDLPFELFYLHSEIYRAGFRARLGEVQAQVVDEQAARRLNDLFFYGVIKRC